MKTPDVENLCDMGDFPRKIAFYDRLLVSLNNIDYICLKDKIINMDLKETQDLRLSDLEILTK
ncbi:MAG: hypothetical protein ABEK59_09655 [Halobacteria archaeon]